MDKSINEKMLSLNEELVLGSAFRYALGSMTYIVGATCEELIRLQNRVPLSFKQRISREIQEYQDENGKAGMSFDNDEWNYIKWLYDEKRHVIVQAFDGKKWKAYKAVKGDNGVYYSLESKNKSYHTVREMKEEKEA